MKQIPTTLALALLLLLSGCSGNNSQVNDPIEYVNALTGTNNNHKFSHGNTFPAVTHPFGMHFWTPQTGVNNDNFIYTFNSDSIRGFRQTHCPSPWIGDYATFMIMPVSGQLKVLDTQRGSSFSHAEEIATPYYYSVHLTDHDVVAEMTATERCGYFRFRFDTSNNKYIVFDAYRQGSSVQISPDKQRITGYCKNRTNGVPDNFICYFILEFDTPFREYGVWTPSEIQTNNTLLAGEHTGAFIQLPDNRSEVNVKISSSYISLEQAELALTREIGNKSFEEQKNVSKNIWNDRLSRIEIKGGDKTQLKTFYSNFYRASLYPRKFYEFDANNNPIYFSPYNGEVMDGYMYTDHCFWDTFRSLHPWHNLISPSISREILQSTINVFRDGGWMPGWTSPGYREYVIRSRAGSIFADAYNKGIHDFDSEKALEGMIKEVYEKAPNISMGRVGYDVYNEKGYLPYPDFHEATSISLEYAYDDYCIARMAEMIGKEDSIVSLFKKRSLYYTNSFDPTTKFMRPRRSDGQWYEPFTPYMWGGPYFEGNSWHHTWGVFHDFEGLASLMGGADFFASRLDSLFIVPVNAPTYGRWYNEIEEMHNASFGQYAHGNQPAQHIPYLYSFAGQPWKTQRLVRKVMDRLYSATPDGYCGDEDNGQTSSWYLFSALGLYPVCPPSGEYVLGSPLFPEVTIHLENGKELIIKAKEVSASNIYMWDKKVNGMLFSSLFINHSDLSEGALLEFEMKNKPNKDQTITTNDLPFSLSR